MHVGLLGMASKLLFWWWDINMMGIYAVLPEMYCMVQWELIQYLTFTAPEVKQRPLRPVCTHTHTVPTLQATGRGGCRQEQVWGIPSRGGGWTGVFGNSVGHSHDRSMLGTCCWPARGWALHAGVML